MYIAFFFFFKQKTAYEMRISDWSSDVCSSDLQFGSHHLGQCGYVLALGLGLAESLAFLLRDIAFVEGDLAAIVDRDIDPPAFALGRFLMLPCRKVRMRWHDLDRAPAVFELGGFARLDFGLLPRPKVGRAW